VENLGSGDLLTIDAVIGDAINKRRVEMGMDTAELAVRLGVGPPQIERFEAGVDRVDARKLMSICGALGVRPKHFFDAVAAALANQRRNQSV